MKIFFDDDIFCRQRVGGISRYFVELIKYLHSANQNVEVGAYVHRNDYLRLLNISGFSKKIKLYDYYGAFRSAKLLNSLIYNNFLRSAVPDIYHQTYSDQNLSFKKKSKHVITIYDLIGQKFGSQDGSEKRNFYLKKDSLLLCDKIISISNHTKNMACDFYKINPDKVSVIHLGIDHNIFNVDSEFQSEFIKLKELNIQKPFLLYVGLRSGYKNFSHFVKAVASNLHLKKNFQIVAFGGGPFDQVERLLLQDLGYCADDVVQFGGSDLLLSELYRYAACFVYPSLDEGFGIPPLEAMACGCAVVVSNSASIPEVVGNAGLYFAPDNIDQTALQIEKAVFDTAVKYDLQTKGLARVKGFTWKTCGEKTLDVYRSLL